MKEAKAIFAGGCFWCLESAFEHHAGVTGAVSGYTGGTVADPTYEMVSSGASGHYEAVEVTYDSDKIGYDELLNVFWRQIDPTDDGGQFADRGTQYRTAIFYFDEGQRAAAEKSKRELETCGLFKKPVVTRILKAGKFYPAEEPHQQYYEKQPLRYELYREGSGRNRFIKETWMKQDRCAVPRPDKRR